MSLADVEAAAEALNRAVTDRAATIGAAVEAGIPVSDVATAAGLTRQTVYRIVRTGGGGPAQRRSRRDILDDALYALIELGAGPAHELASGLRTDRLDAKARRVQHGARNAPPGAQLTDEISQGLLAAAEILKPR